MINVVCKGTSKACENVSDVKSFANEQGYGQFIVLQGGRKVTPATIDFNFVGVTEVIPYDKFAGTMSLDNGVNIELPETVVKNIEIEDEVIIIRLKKVQHIVEENEDEKFDDGEEMEDVEPVADSWNDGEQWM